MTATAQRAPAARRPARTPGWYAPAATLLAGLSLAAVVGLWVRNGGAFELTQGAVGGHLTAIGRLTGLLATQLMLIQVFLMARIPLVERSFGQDTLARWHRVTGFTSFHLMLAHIVLITLGYAAGVDQGPVAQFWSLVTTYPGMLLATAATGCIVLVVLTSIRAARRRLRYESWHLLHLYAYLGIGLALPHQLWTGTDFVSSPEARAFWWGMYLAAAAAVLIWRLGVPLWRSWRHKLQVASVVPEGPGLTSVYLRGRQLEKLPARAGQFMLWRFLDGPGWSRAHPFSLSGPPRADLLRITVKELGDGSRRVSSLQPGTKVLIEGPFGKLTGQSYDGGPVTMFACGIGITPLLALLWELPYRPGEATLVFRARNDDDLAFAEELDWLVTNRGLRVVDLIGPRARPDSWLPREYADYSDIEAVHAIAPDVAGHHVYVCGPDAWTESVRYAMREAGVPGNRLHTERFAW